MRIGMLLSTPFPPQEGIGHYVNNLSNNLITRGHEVSIITRGHMDRREYYTGSLRIVEIPYIPFYPLHVHIHGIAVNKFLARERDKFDLIHLHQPLAPIPMIDLPIISTIHSSMLGNALNIDDHADCYSLGFNAMARTLTASLLKKTYRHSKTVTTVSNPVAKELHSWLGFTNINVVGNGVDTLRFSPGSRSGNYLLYTGRLSHGKGLLDLIEAVAPILRKRPIKLKLCGDGELRNELEKAAEHYGVRDSVQFMGVLDHERLSEIYSNATVFIFPSRYEGMPTSVLEAMSSGLPVIASDIAAHRQIIKDGETGVLFKSGSPRDLRTKLEILLDDSQFQKTLSRNARAEVKRLYTWDRISSQYIDAYRAAVEN